MQIQHFQNKNFIRKFALTAEISAKVAGQGYFFVHPVYTVCPGKKRPRVCFLNFNKLARIAIVFGKQHRECTGQLLL